MTGRTPPRPDPYLDLADQAAHQDAVRARARQRELRERAVELASWVGTLRDLAERTAEVTVVSRSGRAHHGALVGVAEDHVAMRLGTGQLVAIAADAVSSVRPEPGGAPVPATGDRQRAQDRTLIERLDRLVGQRRRVAVVVEGASDVLQGTLAGVGEDVLTLRLDGSDAGVAYVRAGAVLEVIVEVG